MNMKLDVAIIGGGPAGSTVGALLKKYSPNLKVGIFEREVFPRDHVGESHLPAISNILDEMGAWDKVEAGDFPIKIGGTYRWGRTDELWDFEFMPGEKFIEEPRPAKFVGQRRMTAFQVDRSLYDMILLHHARDMGCEVYEGVKTTGVQTKDDKVLGFQAVPSESTARIAEPASVEAKYYVDCSGEAGVLRKALEVAVDCPTTLRNIAIWDYWQDAEWAVTLGKGGTRIQVLSIGWGWLWFIPITPTRTSIGLVLPADYYKASGKSKEQIYADAIAAEPLVRVLVRNATPENNVQATKDWNFLSERLAGDNWFLAGDSCGFADPILSAGMTLAHTSGRKIAYTILELERGQLDAHWLKREYSDGHRAQIKHHMQFADYWYSANGRFTDLKEYCSEIAKGAGLQLDADNAFRWLAAGGFALESPGVAQALTYRVMGIKFITQHFSGEKGSWAVTQWNRFRLSLEGARTEKYALMENGRIRPVECLRRGHKVLPLVYAFQLLHEVLKHESDGQTIVNICISQLVAAKTVERPGQAYVLILETLEAMIAEGWVTGSVAPNRPMLEIAMPEETSAMHRNRDNVPAEEVGDHGS